VLWLEKEKRERIRKRRRRGEDNYKYSRGIGEDLILRRKITNAEFKEERVTLRRESKERKGGKKRGATRGALFLNPRKGFSCPENSSVYL